MKFSKETIEKIKRCGILRIANQYTEMKKSGDFYIGSCPNPAHEDKHPSFVIQTKGVYESWRCYGCSDDRDGSDNIDFIRWINSKYGKGMSFQEAVQYLANFYGITMEEKRDKNESLYRYNLELCRKFQKKLNFEHTSYLFGRGLDLNDIEKWQIGFSDERIMFPILSKSRNILGFIGRLMDEKGQEPKYKNSSTSPIFEKNKVLYGLDKLNPKSEHILITEGVMDVILAHHYGLDYAVAPLCCHLSGHHIEIIKQLGKKPVLCFDGDIAGESGIRKAIFDMQQAEIKGVKVMQMPHGKDLADLANELKNSLSEYIEERIKSYSHFLLKDIADGIDAKLSNEIQKAIPKINEILNNIWRALSRL